MHDYGRDRNSSPGHSAEYIGTFRQLQFMTSHDIDNETD